MRGDALKVRGIAYYNFDQQKHPLKVAEINEYDMLKLPLIISHDLNERYRGVTPGKTISFDIKNDMLYVDAIIYPEYRHLVEKEGFKSFSISFGTEYDKKTNNFIGRYFREISLCQEPVGKECRIIDIKSYSDDLKNNNIKEKIIIFPIMSSTPTTETPNPTTQKEENKQNQTTDQPSDKSTVTPITTSKSGSQPPEAIEEEEIIPFTQEQLQYKSTFETRPKEEIDTLCAIAMSEVKTLRNHNKFLDDDNKTLKRRLEDAEKLHAEKLQKVEEETKKKMVGGYTKKILTTFGLENLNTLPKIAPSTLQTGLNTKEMNSIGSNSTNQNTRTEVSNFSQDNPQRKMAENFYKNYKGSDMFEMYAMMEDQMMKQRKSNY